MRTIEPEDALALFLLIVIVVFAVLIIGSAIGTIDSHAGQYCLIKASGTVDFNECITRIPALQ